MPVTNRNWLGVTAILLLMISAVGAFGAAGSVAVVRGEAGPETVTVHLGEGVTAVWNTRTGTLAEVTRVAAGREARHLLTGPGATSWFVQSEGAAELVTYQWKGYRFNGNQVVLLHELTLVDGNTLHVQERPVLQQDETGLLSLVRTFTSNGSSDAPLIKRVRTATPESVTVPVRTNGQLKPLGLNDNWMADVIFRSQGPTWITTVFNGQWKIQPATASATEEKKP